MGRIGLAILVILCGVAVMYFYQGIYNLFGPIQWFEKNLGDSRSAYALLGAVLVVIGVLVLFGIGTGGPTSIDATLNSQSTQNSKTQSNKNIQNSQGGQQKKISN